MNFPFAKLRRNQDLVIVPLIIIGYALFASASQLNLYEKLVKVRGGNNFGE